MRLPIFLLLVAIVVIAGCANPVLPGEKKQSTVAEKTGEPSVDSVASDISEVSKLNEELDFEEFSSFESDLDQLSW
ncbi:hypothetical protein HY638_05655 [Candidatus Woesearchaeota archaeon]|nr:hypothetical protein [Candidatus Woesearchaeota archaeon]